MIDSQLHTYSIMGTVLAAVGMCAGVYFANDAAGGTIDVDPFANMVVIDAALAQKSAEPPKQPQKETRAPREEVKPVGVSHDENARPVVEPEPKPDKPDIQKVLDSHRSDDDDDDLPVSNTPKIETGKVDGVEVGFGDKTFGNRYLGALKSGFMRGWEYPEILSDVGIPIGCIQLEEDGTIKDTRLLQPSGNAELDDSVERALVDFQKKNNKEPTPLPTTPDDLTFLKRMPLCWRLKV